MYVLGNIYIYISVVILRYFFISILRVICAGYIGECQFPQQYSIKKQI